jgi:hypothetical protein
MGLSEHGYFIQKNGAISMGKMIRFTEKKELANGQFSDSSFPVHLGHAKIHDFIRNKT